MSLSRRSLLAALGVTAAGAAAAGAKLLVPGGAAGAAATAPAPSVAALPTPSLGPTTAPGIAASATATASASASASATASATAAGRAAATSATAAATTAPSPSPSRPMPTAQAAEPTVDVPEVTASPDPVATPLPTGTTGAGTSAAFASGASCVGANDGQFARWRGRETTVASAWGRDGETYVVDPGLVYGSWQGHFDYATQYDLDRTGSSFTWQALADGAYDDRLRTDMRRLKARWQGRPGTLYYRFQHEFNGNWYRWSVDESSTGAMVSGWRRMAGIFRSVFGTGDRYRIAWSPNAGAGPFKFRDIRSCWPGREYVDVIAFDFYDFFKPRTDGDWNRMLMSTDDSGGPIGPGAWQAYAAKQGVPFSVPEWGNQFGDNPFYIERMHRFFAQHAYSGSGPAAGKLLYEVYFNEYYPNQSSGMGDFRVQADGRDSSLRPAAARRYRELFGA